MSCNSYLPCYCHICDNRNYALKCQLCKLVYVPIWGNYVSIYASYELNAINNVTRCTGIHRFHIIGICLWTNVFATLHIYVLLHGYCSLLMDPALLTYHYQTQQKVNFNLPCYCHICANNKYASQLSYINHMLKLLDIHLRGRYANTCVTYEVAAIII